MAISSLSLAPLCSNHLHRFSRQFIILDSNKSMSPTGNTHSIMYPPNRLDVKPSKLPCLSYQSKPQGISMAQHGRGRRQVWRRKKLTKKDDMLDGRLERVPFLEEQVRKIRNGGKLLTMDIEKLLLSEDNRFAFVNEIAAEAKQYVDNNRDEYGAKKAILHVLSNRMNDSGIYRPEAYMEDDPFNPGPGYLREEL